MGSGGDEKLVGNNEVVAKNKEEICQNRVTGKLFADTAGTGICARELVN